MEVEPSSHHNRPVQRDLASGDSFRIEKKVTSSLDANLRRNQGRQPTDFLLPNCIVGKNEDPCRKRLYPEGSVKKSPLIQWIERVCISHCEANIFPSVLNHPVFSTQITSKTMSRCRCDVITPEKRRETDWNGRLFYLHQGDDYVCSPSFCL